MLNFNIPKTSKYVREDVVLRSSKASDGRYETMMCSGFQISGKYVITSRECCDGDVEVKLGNTYDPISGSKVLVDDVTYQDFCLVEFEPLFTLKNTKPCVDGVVELTSACWSFAQARFQKQIVSLVQKF